MVGAMTEAMIGLSSHALRSAIPKVVSRSLVRVAGASMHVVNHDEIMTNLKKRRIPLAFCVNRIFRDIMGGLVGGAM